MKNKHWIKVLFGQRVIVIALLILQVFVMAKMMTWAGRTYHIAEWVLTIVSVIVAIYIVNRQRKPEYKLSWVFLVLLFPVFGGVFYLISHLQTSSRKYRKQLADIREEMDKVNEKIGIEPFKTDREYEQYDTQIQYLEQDRGFSCYKNTKLMYLEPGEQIYTVLLEELKRARQYIFIEFFIIKDGQMWDTVLRILKEKAKEGIQVRLIYDDMGSLLHFTREDKESLEEDGIQIGTFNPFRPVLTVKQSNRDHRKIVVVDGKVAFTGGINLADEYINQQKMFGYWMDAGIFLYGMGAWGFTLMFLQMWALCTGKTEDYSGLYPWKHQLCPVGSDGLVQPYGDGPIDKESTAANVYLQMIYGAKEYLYIESPYLVLGDDFVSAICLAAKSGVDVRIITPSKDFPIVKQNTQGYYADFIKSGVRIFEYSKGMMHSKVSICDDKTAVVGTVNLDYRGLYLHYECGVKLYESSAIRDIKACFVNNMNKSLEIHESDCRKNIFVRLLQCVLRVFAPLF